MRAVRHKAIRDAGGGPILLLCEAGSGLHGIAVEGADDHDEFGVFIEPSDAAFGLQPVQETIVRRSKPEGVRSEPGDTDIVLHTLRKYVRLLIAGNPTVLQTLFVPDDKLYEHSDVYWKLANMAKSLRTRKTAHAFLGYLNAQRDRLIGVRGQKGVKRPELEEAHGYDTKFAAHAMRLGFQGCEFMRTGTLALPMQGDALDFCLKIRRGEIPQAEALHEIEVAAQLLKGFADEPGLPKAPDPKRWNDFVVNEYRKAYADE